MVADGRSLASSDSCTGSSRDGAGAERKRKADFLRSAFEKEGRSLEFVGWEVWLEIGLEGLEDLEEVDG